jgi:CBS domain-containing protein
MRVKEIMTKELIYVKPDTSVVEAAKRMKSANIHAVLVVQEGKLVGIVVDRDLVLKVLAEGLDPAETRIREIMTKDPITVEPETDVIEAAKLMREHRVSRLPVVEQDGRVIGIVSEVDFPTIISKLE